MLSANNGFKKQGEPAGARTSPRGERLGETRAPRTHKSLTICARAGHKQRWISVERRRWLRQSTNPRTRRRRRAVGMQAPTQSLQRPIQQQSA
jgi:hypothetical protein